MRRPPTLWVVLFCATTLASAAAATAASTAQLGSSIRPRVGDQVVYLVPRTVGTCRVGEVATGTVVAGRNDVVTLSRTKLQVGTRLAPELLVNGQYSTTLPAAGVHSFAKTTVPAGSVFLLGSGQTHACDSRVLGPVPVSRLVGYTQAGLDARVAVVQNELNARITAEKYVAGVYLLVFAAFMAYLLIHSSRIGRLEAQLAAQIETAKLEPGPQP